MELRTILIAEDNPNDLELTLEGLSEYSLANQIVAVRDGVEAMDYLTRKGKYNDREPGHPAVILLDIKMPRMDGFEVMKAIRSNPELKFIPVVILTSSREDRDLLDGYALGANAYVVKPVAFKDFMNAVKQIGGFWALVNEPPSRLKG